MRRNRAKPLKCRNGISGAWQPGVNVSLYQAAAAMSANARWQEAISENLASASIPGFKKQDLSFEAVRSGLMPQANLDPSLQFTFPQAKSATNFSQGQLRATGVNTDVAIEGKGFFEVQLPDGSHAYTRDGEFHLNASGQLTTKQGHPVLGEGGPIQLDQNLGGAVSISATGEVSQGEEVRGKLKVVDFEQPKSLTKINGGYFTTGGANILPTVMAQPALRQGFLEGANTSPVAEMASLIGVMRGFEANQRLMQIHDERMGKTISELGNPT
jgi:flagellar basal-body rod protein FlgF